MYLAITYLNHKHGLKLLGIATTDPMLAKKWEIWQLLLLLLLLRIRRPFSDPQRWCRASKTVSSDSQWSGLSFYVRWSSVPQTVFDLEAETYGASLLRRRRRLRLFGPSQRLTEAVKFWDLARAFQKGKLGLSSSKTAHFRGQNWGPVWFVEMNLN